MEVSVDEHPFIVRHRSYRWSWGLACICSTAIIWTIATVAKKHLTQDQSNAYTITCLLNSIYTAHFVTFGVSLAMPGTKPRIHCLEKSQGSLQSFAYTLLVALIIFPMWMLAQYTYNAGVARTSVTASTIAASTSVAWTYLASIVFLREGATSRTTMGVVLCVVGNCMLIVPDVFSTTHSSRRTRDDACTTLAGSALCLTSAVGYACYTTMIKKLVVEDMSVILFLACIGICTLCLALPFSPFIDQGALADLSTTSIGLIVCTGLLDNVVGQYLWAKGVLWTSSTVATVGMSLTIPLALVADFCQGRVLDVIHFAASATVIAGFLIIYYPGSERDV